MKTIYNLFNLINAEKIMLYDSESLNNIHSLGIYFYIPPNLSVIALDKSLLSNTPLYLSVLSEEAGHHFTTFSNLIRSSENYLDKIYKTKDEHKAKKWAADYLISDDDFVQALNDSISTVNEMAEYFNVTEEIIKYKISSIVTNEILYSKIRKNFIKREIPYLSCAI
ncbi:ImmA/IrrE family metallo-endopeptidase [Clostridium sp. BJN0001]|uniref:ImmA/IrrE family metallo-endopeptidase n=1 Tax=Clostridium sp. BJN0001 TaxID=2930219 RepID=UPI001FD13BB2|nr:ImmA/IrrE family metallo-endopeptidase [Clostridium sp. BJN0001]